MERVLVIFLRHLPFLDHALIRCFVTAFIHFTASACWLRPRHLCDLSVVSRRSLNGFSQLYTRQGPSCNLLLLFSLLTFLPGRYRWEAYCRPTVTTHSKRVASRRQRANGFYSFPLKPSQCWGDYACMTCCTDWQAGEQTTAHITIVVSPNCPCSDSTLDWDRETLKKRGSCSSVLFGVF